MSPTAAEAAAAEDAALDAAKRLGTPIEVVGSKSETARTVATPQGTLKYESYAVPRWTAKNGKWRQIDTSLRQSLDGSVAPVATLVDVEFSAGGTGPAVIASVGGGQLSMFWPTVLPAPRLVGETAIYESVLTGVDLQLRSATDGFSWVLVVRTPEAAANPALERLAFQLSTSALTARSRTGGGFEVVDPAGDVVLSAGSALMWDSSGIGQQTARTLDSAAEDPVEHAVPDMSRKAELPTSVQGADLVIEPDLALLRGADTTYPVMIDPFSTINKTRWGYAGSTGATRDDGIVRVGSNPDGSGIYRSFFAFNLTGLSGKTISNVKFLTTMTHSYSCTASPVNLWRTAALTSSGKQTWDGPNLQQHLQELSGNAHKPPAAPSCPNDPQPNKPMEFAATALKNDVIAARGQTSYTLALSTRQSDGSSESTSTWWKKFDAGATKLTVEYNTPPSTPTAAQLAIHADYTAAGQPCATGTDRPVVRSKSPWLKAKLTDPDGTNGGKLSGVFTVQQWDGSAWVGITGWPQTKSGVVHGTNAEIQFSSNVTGRFRWQVQTLDTLGGASGLSPWCEFDNDDTPPGAIPSVTPADGMYLESPPRGTNQDLRGALGFSGQFTLGAGGDPDVYDYVYQLDGGMEMTVPAANPGGAATVWVTPTHIGANVLTVRSRDQAGNRSDPYDYVFLVGEATAPKAVWSLNEGSGWTLRTSPVGGPDVTLVNGPTWADGRSLGNHEANGRDRAVWFNGVDEYGATAVSPSIDWSRSFSVAAWARPFQSGTFAAVVGPSGAHNGPWKLQRDKNGLWWFHTFSADNLTHVRTSVSSPQPAAIKAWQHVAGVYDAGLKQIRIYVDGALVNTQPLGSLWASDAIMQIGRVRYNDTEGNYFHGDIDDIRLWDRVIDPDLDLQPLVAPVLAGQWEMEDYDEEAPRQVTDDAPYRRSLTLTDSPSAQWCENGYNYSLALCFDGLSGMAQTDGPVLRTDDSYTVSAWVKPTAFGSFPTVVSQCGVERCAFYLQRQNTSPASWAIVLPDTDLLSTSTYYTAKWSGTPSLDDWVHLAATYNAVRAEIKLYVNGVLVATTSGIPTRWQAGGTFRIGHSDSGSSVEGAVDRVRAWVGVLSDADILALANEP
ncbi:LamG domain-containing protein [Micromonospora sonneratiae]